jgi:hypothetical protein
MVVGDNEYLRDETCTRLAPHLLMVVCFASRFAKKGGAVRLKNYMSMPHVFQMFRTHPSVKMSYREFAKFIKEVTNGNPIETQMSLVNVKGITEKESLNLEKYSVTFTKEEVRSRPVLSDSSY